MNVTSLTKSYRHLSPEERFRLILAASERGDESEKERLVASGGRITLSVPDHSPFACAFDELSRLTFLELLEDATRYMDAFERAETTEEDCDTKKLDLALAAGYVLRTKADGWKLFCERLNVPPFLLWQDLPGHSRLHCLLGLSEKAAFTAEGFLRYINDGRPQGASARTTVSLTTKTIADETEALFRHRVQWWGGEMEERA